MRDVRLKILVGLEGTAYATSEQKGKLNSKAQFLSIERSAGCYKEQGT